MTFLLPDFWDELERWHETPVEKRALLLRMYGDAGRLCK